MTKMNKGFTLTELLVSIAIVSVILTVVILNQSKYTDGAALTNLADEISLAISQAQAYSIGVREFSPGSSDFTGSYGLHFQTSVGGGADDSYIFWADRNGNGIYDNGWSCPRGCGSECLGKTFITRGNTLSSICLIKPNSSEMCPIGGIHISFTRPESRAKLIFFNQGGNYMDPQPENIGVKIRLISPGGLIRSVSVFNTGQISVQ